MKFFDFNRSGGFRAAAACNRRAVSVDMTGWPCGISAAGSTVLK
jgi:hypothetical protein